LKIDNIFKEELVSIGIQSLKTFGLSDYSYQNMMAAIMYFSELIICGNVGRIRAIFKNSKHNKELTKFTPKIEAIRRKWHLH
jgi:hypothetical protein